MNKISPKRSKACEIHLIFMEPISRLESVILIVSVIWRKPALAYAVSVGLWRPRWIRWIVGLNHMYRRCIEKCTETDSFTVCAYLCRLPKWTCTEIVCPLYRMRLVPNCTYPIHNCWRVLLSEFLSENWPTPSFRYSLAFSSTYLSVPIWPRLKVLAVLSHWT